MQESSWDKVRYSLWTWWVVITAIYLLIPLLFGPLSSLASLIIRTIGLFVPIAQLSLMGIFISGMPFAFLSVPVLFLLLFVCNKALNRFNLTGIKRIILNLILLFVLTIISDLIIYHTWQSINFLIMKSIEF